MRTSPFTRRGLRGFSLIELMVGVAVSLLVTLVMFNVLAASETRKRSTTSVNDINQGGTYASYMLDRAVRSAGSGFTGLWDDAVGCPINAVRDGTAVLPRAAAFPAPFAGIPQTLRLAPAVIFRDQPAAGTDTLILMAGAAGFGEQGTQVLAEADVSSTPASVRLRNTIGFGSSDLLLVARSGEPCLLSQVSTATVKEPDDLVAGAEQELRLDGTYYTATNGATGLAALTSDSTARIASLGNVAPIAGVAGNPPVNPPQFRLFGVGDNLTLMSHDPLRTDNSDEPVPVTEGVRQIRAVYGVDTNNDGVLEWVAPSVAPWNAASLLDGSVAARNNLRNIRAVRIALVLRTSLIERELAPGQGVTTTPLTLFADLPVAVQETVAFAGADQNFRYRVFETTVPLRNMLLLP